MTSRISNNKSSDAIISNYSQNNIGNEIEDSQSQESISKNTIELNNGLIVTEHSAEDLERKILNDYEKNLEEQERLKIQTEIETVRDERNFLENELKRFGRVLNPQDIVEKNRLMKRLMYLEKREQELSKKQYTQKQKEKNRMIILGMDKSEESDLVRRGVITPFEAMKIRNETKKTAPTITTIIKSSIQRKPVEFTSNAQKLKKFQELEKNRAERLIKQKQTTIKSDSQNKPSKKRKRSQKYLDESETLDDGDEKQYKKRMKLYHEEHNENEEQEIAEVFDDIFKVPSIIWDQLFDYQQTCVKWMWELHRQGVGGIIGDEMGLGKTVQISSFLGSLHYSGLFTSSLIICPATVMKQWVRELHHWWPQFRVSVYHSSGTASDKEQLVLDLVESNNGILITTYEAVRLQPALLVKQKWGYVILDEGHKLKNPDSEITLTCKHFQTPHRIILTGTPIQNNLKELWSLFDFVYPGKLGTLPLFQSQFGVPISMGGFSNATQAQVETAYQCAVTLRDLISPYLLRRVKKDVNHSLPQKEEKVLFCKLTPEQVHYYLQYLKSQEVHDALNGEQTVFQAVIQLRKICNHPNLATYASKMKAAPGEKTKFPTDDLVERSGKLRVVDHLLKAWKEGNNRVLLFSQSVKMLNILEEFLNMREYEYRRMDGTTQIEQRMKLIDEFNNDKKIFVFLLTTKVGGIGVNLTGADRVILYDPDWNPSTDQQSLERAWRIGQNKDVTVYRLMTQGTIEEKIYHRQIFKTFLSNKILQDPRQKRFFKQSQLYDLFTLGKEYFEDTSTNESETSKIFNLEIPTIEKRQESNRMKRKSDADKIQEEELYRIEEFIHETEESQKEQENKESSVLQNIFNDNTIGSVFDHDKIISESRPEKGLLEKEAFKIASSAAKKLLEFTYENQNYKEFEPTWTGAFGSRGSSEKRFGNIAASIAQNFLSQETQSSNNSSQILRSNNGASLTSSQLLGVIKNREANTEKGDKGNILMKSLIKYFQSKGGKVTSSALVSRFESEAKGNDAVLFKCLLKEIALFDKESKSWKLKDEFKRIR